MPPEDQSPLSRRALLIGAGTATVGTLSGCLTSSVVDSQDDAPAVVTTIGSETQTDSEYSAYADATIESARETGLSVRESVVALSRDPPDIEGTGWYFQSDDILATAGHIVALEEDWDAWQVDGTRLDTTYVNDAYLDGTDVGMLRTEVSGVPLSAGSTDDLEPGQPLIEVGNPGGAGNWVISLGRYLGDTDGEADGFLTSNPARGGSSGSPVVTLDGAVVGLHSGRAELEDLSRADPDSGKPAVYGPNDRTVKNEIVGIKAVAEQVEGWTDA
jgi:S1-C subfamily serine protease